MQTEYELLSLSNTENPYILCSEIQLRLTSKRNQTNTMLVWFILISAQLFTGHI